MKTKITTALDIIVESINYVIINYALSNMALLFNSSILYVLFFASEVWVMSNYWRKVRELTGSKMLTLILLIICFIVHCGMIYFIGRISGTIVPFNS